MESVVLAEPIQLEARMYRPSEVSKLTRIPQPSIYGWIRTKQIKATRIGGRLFVPPGELARLLGCESPPADAEE